MRGFFFSISKVTLYLSLISLFSFSSALDHFQLRGIVYPTEPPTPVPTPTPTQTLTPTPTVTTTPSPSSSPTATPTPSPSSSSTPSSTPTSTSTPTLTPTFSPSPSPSPSPSVTNSPSASPSPSETPTPTPTSTPTITNTPTPTPAVQLPSPSPFGSSSPSPSPTPTAIASPTPSPSSNPTPEEEDSTTSSSSSSSVSVDTLQTFLLTGGSAVLTLEDDEGNSLIYINVPPSVVQGEITITIRNRTEPGIVSPIISVDLEGEDGALQPDGSLELCFYVQEDRVEELRLASFDETDDCWQKEDRVEVRDRRVNAEGEEELLVCGETDHFTDFSILLQGGADVCSDGEGHTETLLIILSAVGIVAFTLVVAVVILSYNYCRSFRHVLQGEEANRVEQLRDLTHRGRGLTEPEPVENSLV